MMIDSPILLRGAGYAAAISLVALVLSGIALALFFGGAGEFWGPVNDVFIAISLLALILPVFAVDRLAAGQAEPWLRVVTIAAVAGIVIGALGQLLLVVGVIDLNASYVTGGVGIMPVLGWIVAVAILSLNRGVLAPSVGWLAVGVLVLIIALSVVATMTMGPPLWATAVALTVVISAWLGCLAAELLARVTAG